MPTENLLPITRKASVVEEIHGVKITDPYRWLEGNNDEVRKWIKEQNDYSLPQLYEVPERAQIQKRLNELFRIDAFGAPVPRQGRYFFEGRIGGDDLSVLYVQDGLYGSSRILINPNTLSLDKTTALHGWSPSRDGRLLAYSLSEAANDKATVFVMDVDAGQNLADTIPAETYPSPHTPIVWDYDNSGFWYTRRQPGAPSGEEKFHQKLYFHKLGNSYESDEMVFGENIAKEDIPWLSLSEDGQHLLVSVYMLAGKSETMELFLFNRKNPQKGFISLTKKRQAMFYGKMHRGFVYVQTDFGAPLGKVMSFLINEADQGIEAWKTVVPESRRKIESFVIVSDRIFVESLKDVCSSLSMYGLNGRPLSEISLPALGSIGEVTSEWNGKELFFQFSSFMFPPAIYRFDLASNEYAIFKQAESGIDSGLYCVEQIWFDSRDGTRIPMFLVCQKGLAKSGDNPTFLSGYGGFGVSKVPVFNKSIIPFLEQGGIYVLVNLRGGGELGEEWHKAGTRERKQNVFDDFIAAAEWLVERKYSSPRRLAIFGWSNGGLLVSAAMTQRPDLFKAVVIGAPVVDMLRYHLFFGGRHWIPEYGCADNPEDFRYLLEYCPYQNVRMGENYPATLLVASDMDDRVHPMHAYKMTARLQDANASDNPIMIRVEARAGHGGAAAVSRFVEQFTDILCFVFWQMKIE